MPAAPGDGEDASVEPTRASSSTAVVVVDPLTSPSGSGRGTPSAHVRDGLGPGDDELSTGRVEPVTTEAGNGTSTGGRAGSGDEVVIGAITAAGSDADGPGAASTVAEPLDLSGDEPTIVVEVGSEQAAGTDPGGSDAVDGRDAGTPGSAVLVAPGHSTVDTGTDLVPPGGSVTTPPPPGVVLDARVDRGTTDPQPLGGAGPFTVADAATDPVDGTGALPADIPPPPVDIPQPAGEVEVEEFTDRTGTHYRATTYTDSAGNLVRLVTTTREERPPEHNAEWVDESGQRRYVEYGEGVQEDTEPVVPGYYWRTVPGLPRSSDDTGHGARVATSGTGHDGASPSASVVHLTGSPALLADTGGAPAGSGVVTDAADGLLLARDDGATSTARPGWGTVPLSQPPGPGDLDGAQVRLPVDPDAVRSPLRDAGADPWSVGSRRFDVV